MYLAYSIYNFSILHLSFSTNPLEIDHVGNDVTHVYAHKILMGFDPIFLHSARWRQSVQRRLRARYYMDMIICCKKGQKLG